MPCQKRTIFFVDGFNLYHAIDEYARYYDAHYLKWLDLLAVAQALAHPKDDVITDGYYFSAYARHRGGEVEKRHRAYVRALQSTGIHTVMGKFKRRHMQCRACDNRFSHHEEKETDVNLAIQMVRLAYEDAYDKALLFTADTDLAPAVRLVRETFPEKDIRIVFPSWRKFAPNALINAANGKIRLKIQHLERNQLPDEIKTPKGIITRPEKYRR